MVGSSLDVLSFRAIDFRNKPQFFYSFIRKKVRNNVRRNRIPAGLAKKSFKYPAQALDNQNPETFFPLFLSFFIRNQYNRPTSYPVLALIISISRATRGLILDRLFHIPASERERERELVAHYSRARKLALRTSGKFHKLPARYQPFFYSPLRPLIIALEDGERRDGERSSRLSILQSSAIRSRTAQRFD